APIGMALVSLDGRFVRVSRALCQVLGYAPDELTNLTFMEITHPEDLSAEIELRAKLSRGEISNLQIAKRYLRKDGTAIDVMLSASVLRRPDGTPLYYVSQIEDITARKRAEEALRASEQFLS